VGSTVRKTPFGKNEILADRMEEAAKKVAPKDCRGWIRHSQKHFSKRLNMERM
ncbi:hypothetical protein BCV72DRAFT_218377, partial [Rhizopus microsporus var. microsporus]